MNRTKQKHFFIFKANCYKRTAEDDIVFREKYNDLWEYGVNGKAYMLVDNYFSYDKFEAQQAIKLYLRKHPKCLMNHSEVFIMQNESNEEENVFLIYFSTDSNRWEVIASDDPELNEWNLVTAKQSKMLYENFKNFIIDYNNNKPYSYLEEKYLKFPVKIGK